MVKKGQKYDDARTNLPGLKPDNMVRPEISIKSPAI